MTKYQNHNDRCAGAARNIVQGFISSWLCERLIPTTSINSATKDVAGNRLSIQSITDLCSASVVACDPHSHGVLVVKSDAGLIRKRRPQGHSPPFCGLVDQLDKEPKHSGTNSASRSKNRDTSSRGGTLRLLRARACCRGSR